MKRGTGYQGTGNPRAPLSLNLRLGWMYSLLASFPGASQVALVVKNPPANAGDVGSIPRLERSPGGRHGKPLQYSCLENPMDRGAWRTIVHGVAKSQSWLRQLSMHACKMKPLHELLTQTFVKNLLGNFPGGPGVKTPCFQCKGCGFDPWLGN